MARKKGSGEKLIPDHLMNTDHLVFPEFGRCIYCGTKDGPLSKEHIVPYSLGGNWIIPKASCEECGKKTQKIEEVCMSERWGMFYPLRMYLKLQSRRKKTAGNTITAPVLNPDGTIELRKFQFDLFPQFLWRMELPPAGILSGKAPNNMAEVKIGFRFANKDSALLADRPIRVSSINPTAFYQLIAKIGWCYAAAMMKRTDTFMPIVRDSILHKTDKHPFVVGGGMPFDQDVDPSSYSHRLSMHLHMTGNRIFTIVQVHLFGSLGFPKYHVVISESRTEDRPLFDHRLHT